MLVINGLRALTLAVLMGSVVATCAAADPCRSGLQPGQRPGPYSALIATGPERGQSYCYVCETGERPGVVIFARTLNDSLAELVHRVDKALGSQAGLRAWVTFLNDNQPAFDRQVLTWAQAHAIRQVPLGVFEDTGGPPSYRLAPDADVTVILFSKRQVTANFAFRKGELGAKEIEELMKAVAGMNS